MIALDWLIDIQIRRVMLLLAKQSDEGHRVQGKLYFGTGSIYVPETITDLMDVAWRGVNKSQHHENGRSIVPRA